MLSRQSKMLDVCVIETNCSWPSLRPGPSPSSPLAETTLTTLMRLLQSLYQSLDNNATTFLRATGSKLQVTQLPMRSADRHRCAHKQTAQGRLKARYSVTSRKCDRLVLTLVAEAPAQPRYLPPLAAVEGGGGPFLPTRMAACLRVSNGLSSSKR